MMYVLDGQVAWVQHSASGAASATGERGAASATLAATVTGINGKAKAGKFGCIALAWWNSKQNRIEMHCALVGPGRLKQDTWYTLDNEGKFIEAVSEVR